MKFLKTSALLVLTAGLAIGCSAQTSEAPGRSAPPSDTATAETPAEAPAETGGTPAEAGAVETDTVAITVEGMT
jgi:hypothetical protein